MIKCERIFLFVFQDKIHQVDSQSTNYRKTKLTAKRKKKDQKKLTCRVSRLCVQIHDLPYLVDDLLYKNIIYMHTLAMLNVSTMNP